MKKYNASAAAAELGIEAKLLRRLLRDDPAKTFKAPGSGGGWEFSTADIPALRKIVEAHTNRPKGSKTARTTVIRDDAGLPIKVARSNDPASRAAVKALSIERVDRLEAALKAAGLHISQMSVFGDDRRRAIAEELVAAS